MKEVDHFLVQRALILAGRLSQACMELSVDSQPELSGVLTTHGVSGLLPVVIMENLFVTLGADPDLDGSLPALAIDDQRLDDLLGLELTLAAVRAELRFRCRALTFRLREL